LLLVCFSALRGRYDPKRPPLGALIGGCMVSFFDSFFKVFTFFKGVFSIENFIGGIFCGILLLLFVVVFFISIVDGLR